MLNLLACGPQVLGPPRDEPSRYEQQHSATALTASIGHAVQLAQGHHSELGTILSLLLFTVPGVIVGAQIGAAVARYIPQRTMMVGMEILFILVAAPMLGEVILNVR